MQSLKAIDYIKSPLQKFFKAEDLQLAIKLQGNFHLISSLFPDMSFSLYLANIQNVQSTQKEDFLFTTFPDPHFMFKF